MNVQPPAPPAGGLQQVMGDANAGNPGQSLVTVAEAHQRIEGDVSNLPIRFERPANLRIVPGDLVSAERQGNRQDQRVHGRQAIAVVLADGEPTGLDRHIGEAAESQRDNQKGGEEGGRRPCPFRHPGRQGLRRGAEQQIAEPRRGHSGADDPQRHPGRMAADQTRHRSPDLLKHRHGQFFSSMPGPKSQPSVEMPAPGSDP